MLRQPVRTVACGSAVKPEPERQSRSPGIAFQNIFPTVPATTALPIIPNLTINHAQPNLTSAEAAQADKDAALVPPDLTSGRLLARNTLWNIASLAAPLLVALAAVPILIRSIGIERFGVLSVAWMLIGYFSLFDFGIDQGITKLVADRLATGERHTIPTLVWTSLVLLLLLGIIAGAVMALLSPWIIERALKIPSALRPESLVAFYLLSFGMPMALVTSGARGVLEAMQSFHLLSAVRIPMAFSTLSGH
jgi:hypothetical protein